MSAFVHLHVHSEYSLLEGALRIDDCIAAARAYEMPAVAITDTNALYGAVQFYQKAKAAGIRPILGVQLHVSRTPAGEAQTKSLVEAAQLDVAVLLAENFAGYQELVRLVSLAHTRQRLPFVTLAELSQHANGLFALIGGGESIAVRQLSDNQEPSALAWLEAWYETWPVGSLFVDLQDHALPEERKGLPAIVRWARQRAVPLVATNDVHYRQREDAPVQQVLSSIEGGGRRLAGDRYEFASPEEMARRFSKIPEALVNAAELAARCDVQLPLGQPLLPQYPTQADEPAPLVLRRAAEAGVRQRYTALEETVRTRLEYELSVIEQMGFSDYFLVVADFIRFAHKHGISTGPGRGSAAGSLVAYALRITDVDPLRHQLTFERFLNPERISWPDIDTDFEYERRGEVIQYVVERYGRNHVAQIGTFGTLAAKASLRDAGRSLGTDARIVDNLAKLIPSYPGVTLEQALADTPALAAALQANEPAQALWTAAKAIEGLPRHTSVHAAGVVISPVPLDSLVPVQPGADGTPVTQFAMADIETLGLLKMDFLGLKTLTLIDQTVASVERRLKQKLDWRSLSEDDAPTYAMLSRGDADGCFQLESTGMRRVLRDSKPAKLDDLVALISLFRPGPMENIPTYVAAKHGKTAPHYLHADLEPILRDTYGVIIYQEQIMQIAAVMAGFSMGQADLLRRAVSKKKREVLDAERSRFVQGCLSRGYEDRVANDVYDLIVRFADYGFPRAHAAAYAVLAYRTAYLRANHLPDFLAALLSMHMGAVDKAADYGRDAKKHGVQLLPPSVNESSGGYSVDADGRIRTGLLAVRNVGRAAVSAVLEARRDAPFQSMVDFLSRVNARLCNRKAVESLLAAGALDAFLPQGAQGPVRMQLLEEAYTSIQAGPLQRDLFAAGASVGGALYIRINGGVGARATLAKVKQIVQSYPGEVRVALFDGGKRTTRVLGEPYSVKMSPELIGALEEVVGIGNARMGRGIGGV